jgi:hypothetical protein
MSEKLLSAGQNFNSIDNLPEIDIVFLFQTINRDLFAAWPNFPEQLAQKRSPTHANVAMNLPIRRQDSFAS